MKATHNGTCQVCGRAQAVKAKGLAKHGYTVDWGQFDGVCQGSGEAPVEESTDLLDATVSRLRSGRQALHSLFAEDIKGVEVMVENPNYNAWGRGSELKSEVRRMMSREEWEAHNARQPRWGQKSWPEAQAEQVERNLIRARDMLEHAESLERLKEQRHGEPLWPRG